MIVNKNSWHYKLYRYTYGKYFIVPDRTNLCQYVRRILISPIFLLYNAFDYWQTPFVIAAIASLAMTTLFVAHHGWMPLLRCFIMVAGALLMIVTVISVGICVSYGVTKFRQIDTSQNIFIAWLRAKKEKVCPLITFDDK